MASANLSAYNAALKQTWTEDKLYEQIYQGDDLLSEIEKTTRYQVGRQAVTPIHVSRNGGYTALPAGGGALNTAGNQGMNQAVWNYTHHHQQIAVEGEVIDGSNNNTLSVANSIDTEVSGGLTDLRRQLVRQIAGPGSGVITTCGTTTASTTVTLLQTNSVNNAIERGWLFVNALIDVGTAAAPTTRAASRTITAVDDSAYTIGISGAAITTTSGTDQISYQGSRGAGTNAELNSLLNLVSTTATVGGISVASEPTWKSPIVDSTAQALTLPLVYALPRKIQQKSGEKPDYLLTSLKQQENLYKLLQAQVRYNSDSSIDTGNVDKPTVGGMTVNAMFDIQNEHLFALKKNDFFIVATDKPKWQNAVTGGEILVWQQGFDAYVGKCSYRINLVTRRRNTSGAYTALS